MRPPTTRTIAKHYQAAETVALKLIEQRARKILKEHPKLKEFVMCMGSAQFTLKNRDVFDSYSTYDDTYPRYLNPVFDLIDEWDRYLKLTGTPMRFTADGPKITNW